MYIYIYIYICIYIYVYICHDEATLQSFHSAMNVLSSLWFDMCTMWFVASLSCINMTLKS